MVARTGPIGEISLDTIADAGSRRTLVDRIIGSRPAAALVAVTPVPLLAVRWILLWDNSKENRRDSWRRLRSETEAARYATVRAVTERYGGRGFVLDLGCSQGILQEGLRYRRYVGVDNHRPSIDIAQAKANVSTTFVVGDAHIYVPDEPPDAVVLNEVVYYLRNPTRAIKHQAAQLADDGVVVLSIYNRAWASRHLLRMLRRHFEIIESIPVTADHLSWTVVVYRPLSSG